MDVLFVSSVAVVSADPPASRKLFVDALGLPLEHRTRQRVLLQREGRRHDVTSASGPWPRQRRPASARSTWPSDRIVPQASIEFEVADA